MDFKKSTANLLLVGLLCFSSLLFSQEQKKVNRCATDEYNAELLKHYPKMMGSNSYEKMLSEQIQANRIRVNQRGGVVYTIPIVVHVIHAGESIGTGPNISDAQVLSQIKVLNDDFRRMLGSNGHNTHPDGADVEVEFALAKRTPDGCITNGIDRIDMSHVATSWAGTTNTGNTEAILKPTTIWDPSKYLNIWTVNFSISGLLGFAQFPGTLTASTDGVVVGYQYFGSSDDPDVTLPDPDFTLGRTTTHEVGHYLGLYHTFQGGCAETDGGDLCADTPPVEDQNTNSSKCVVNNSCTESNDEDDMIENYMDYSTDVCMNVFTNDQKARIIATLTTATNRPTTFTSDVCTPLAPVVNDGALTIEAVNVEDCSFNVTPSFRVTNWGTSTLTTATISCDVDGGNSINYNWTGSLDYGEFEVVTLPTMTASFGGHTLNSTILNPNGSTDSRSCNDVTSSGFNIDQAYVTTQVHLTLTPDNYGDETTWEFRDSSGAVLNSGGPYTRGDTTVINESFSVSSNKCYTFVIFDKRTDGICCGLFGDGSYQLKTDDDTLIVSGGEFKDLESTNVSTMSTLSTNDYFVNNEAIVYPNPTTNNITIKLANNQLPDAYKVYNMLGQLVKQQRINQASQLTIDASSFSNGMYFVKVIKDGSATSLPFIKK